MVVQVGLSIEFSGAMYTSQSLGPSMCAKVVRELSPVAVNHAAANVRANEARNST